MVVSPQSGTLHEYHPKLTAFEFGSLGSEKVVIFIGGLTDGLLTVPYVPQLAERAELVGWTVFQILFSSSYIGYGTGSLHRDALEISYLVKYLRTTLHKKKVVLMGHSTGCQDTMQYLVKLERSLETDIDGGIIQASVSDRQAMEMMFESNPDQLHLLNQKAKEYIKQGKKDEVLPKEFSDAFLGAPITAYRWDSFSSKNGDDDFFSSDLSDDDIEAIFGKVAKPLLVLYSGSDEFVPKSVDKHKLVQRWSSLTPSPFFSCYSQVVKGATHNIGPTSEQSAVPDMLSSVEKFLADI